ncbi:tannase/feruloyl esterase family alpha/beta hydrolase [Oceanicola sp. D3]|uniref:tannase/feruloyl esterase family alpha/beta hydrolase n=1 Tax=Oceanicola sp. D3 TaxID=2587163 RepID=UPI001122B647|nr:tannase/feruloyl esterase family alpha/beta hydrolase [Oceanicola sp. D3]QDC09589.1 tannase/feruloyl esterase family alpha/beta hydrolase [Oceanicola sp. D3]
MRLAPRRAGAACALAIVLPGTAVAATDCADMAETAPAGVTITEATALPEGDDHSMVAQCLLRGTMAERIGADGKPYALRFELRLPAAWEGRFLHQFNGGNDGEVKPATGAGTGVGAPALERGFAVVSSDAGHDGKANPEAGLVGGNLFGLDFEARRDYGYGAVAKLHPVALALTEAHYGTAPAYVYGYGTSNGGRHAMVAAERMPEAFDGLLAGYPGFRLPRAAIQHAWDVQQLRSVAPTLAESFSPAELGLVAGKINAACDGLDGLEDGVVADTAGCQQAFNPADMVCQTGQNSACLSAEKVAALEAMHAGPTDGAGTALYSDWPWDPGIASGNWRFWKIESTVPPWGMQPIIAVMGAGSLAHVFSTPPTMVEGSPEALEAYLMGYDFDSEAAKVDAVTEAFPESPMQVMSPPGASNPTLEELEAAGGKLVVFHGTADPVFSFNDTAAWFEKLTANTPGASAFARFYAIPGMPHGRGGNAADSADLLGALIDWVEGDTPPQAVPTTFRAGNVEAGENAGGERMLCPWPQVLRFSEGVFACAE